MSAASGPGTAKSILAVLVITVTALAAAAQPKPGDLLISDYGSVSDIVVLDPATSQRTTLIGFPWISPIDDVIMDLDNLNMRASLGGSITSHAFWQVTPQGATQRRASIPGLAGFFVAGYTVDQNGAFPFSSPNGGLYRVVGTMYTTLVASSSSMPWHRVAVDQDLGYYVAARSTGDLLAVDRISAQVRTLNTGLGSLTDIDFSQRGAGYYVTAAPGGVFFVDQNGNVQVTVTSTSANAIKVDQETDTLYVCGSSGVTHYATTGTAIATWTGVGSYLTGIEIYGSRKLAPGAEGMATTRASQYGFALNFRQSPNAFYCCALSLTGMRPGIAVGGGRTVNIAIDALFSLTVCSDLPGLTSGFAGVLDGNGSATGWFLIPSFVPAGTAFTLAAVAVNPQLPSSLDVAASLGIVVD